MLMFGAASRREGRWRGERGGRKEKESPTATQQLQENISTHGSSQRRLWNSATASTGSSLRIGNPRRAARSPPSWKQISDSGSNARRSIPLGALASAVVSIHANHGSENRGSDPDPVSSASAALASGAGTDS
eukprot:2197139-Rhodomonas_salina.2